jgi:RNA polymerase sigma-70 factor (ECF subfamily)
VVIGFGEAWDTGGPATDFELLLARARAGDVESAGLLLWPHKGRVWRIAYNMLQHRQDTEDVVQETFLKAFRSLRGLEADHPRVLEVWLVRIAMNTARDMIRRPLVGVGVEVPERVDDNGSTLADQATRSLRLLDLLRDLPFSQRAAAVLVDMYGYTRQEAAEMLGIPKGTVDSSVFTARTKLRAGWEAEHV